METYFYHLDRVTNIGKGINYDGDPRPDDRLVLADKLWRVAAIEHSPDDNRRRIYLQPKQQGDRW